MSGEDKEQRSAQEPDSAAAPSGRTPDIRYQEQKEGWAVPIDRIDAFTQGAAMAVEPDRIEQELAALWRQAAERAQDTSARFAVTRACLWNLIVHIRDHAELRQKKRILDELCESVPARLIVLHELSGGEGNSAEDPHAGLGGHGGPPLRTFVEANIRRRTDGRREVVSEEITLEVPIREGARLPGLVRTLLLPDVPTALWLSDPAHDNAWLPRLAFEVERVLFDSSKLANGVELAQAAAALLSLYPPIHRGRPRVEVCDLSWLRLHPWRLLVSSLFDEPAARLALYKLQHVHIRYVQGAETSALLMAGWLISRLGLRVVYSLDTHRHSLQMQTIEDGQAVHKVTLELDEVPAAGRDAPSGIDAVTLRCGALTFTASDAIDTRCIRLASPLAPQRLQPVHGRPDSEFLVAAMGVGGRDPLMYEALRHGAQLIWGASQRSDSAAAPAPFSP